MVVGLVDFVFYVVELYKFMVVCGSCVFRFFYLIRIKC